MNNVAIILAAGSGTRMHCEKSKLLLEINGKTVIERTVETFCKINEINEVIVVCRKKDLDSFEAVLSSYDISYCFGGDTRQQSVMNAVETVDDCDYLIIHDGARPLITTAEIQEALQCAVKNSAAAVGVPVKDTIKVVDSNMKIVDTPDRASLISIRTPQIFEYKLYMEAVGIAKEQGKDFTDDCQLIENCGKPIYVTTGDYGNIKITTPEDIPMAESIIKMRGELK